MHGGIAKYEAHYFFLPLWNSTFSPTAADPGVIDWFTLLIGLTVVVALTIHGANWVILKTSSSVNMKLAGMVRKLSFALIGLSAFSAIAWISLKPESLENFGKYPIFILFPVLYLAGMIGLIVIKGSERQNFFFSTMIIVGGIAGGVASMFPALLPSTNSISNPLTIYNTTTTEYGLSVATSWAIVGFVLLAIYVVVQYRLMKGKIDKMEYGH